MTEYFFRESFKIDNLKVGMTVALKIKILNPM